MASQQQDPEADTKNIFDFTRDTDLPCCSVNNEFGNFVPAVASQHLSYCKLTKRKLYVATQASFFFVSL